MKDLLVSLAAGPLARSAILACGALYVLIAAGFFLKGDRNMAGAFGCYAVANWFFSRMA